MHAILTPVGSAGDVNPFVTVGAELRRRGHRATLIAPEVFADLASRADIDFVPVGTASQFDQTTRNPDLWHPRRGPAVVFAAIAGQLQQAYAAIGQVFEPGRTVLVGHSLSFFTRVFEEVHAAPAVTVHLSPSVFRSEFVQPVVPPGLDLSGWPRWTKRTLWWAIDRFGIDPLIGPALNRWRAELGLQPVSRIMKGWLHSPQRVIGLFPDWFGDPQPDWPPQLTLTGFVLSDARYAAGPGRRVPDARLDEYLADGDAPIVVTPGTANRHAEAFFRAAIDATATIGRRALVVTPYRDQLPPALPPHAHHIDYAPFDRLFPRAAAVIHHGGIGTCAQAFAAGVPQVVMPIGFDQPDNAARVKRLGVGDAIPAVRFDSRTVAAALALVLTNPAIVSACQRWRSRIGIDSPAQACDLIEEAATCRPTASRRGSRSTQGRSRG